MTRVYKQSSHSDPFGSSAIKSSGSSPDGYELAAVDRGFAQCWLPAPGLQTYHGRLGEITLRPHAIRRRTAPKEVVLTNTPDESDRKDDRALFRTVAITINGRGYERRVSTRKNC